MAHVGALRALQQAYPEGLPVGVTVFIEGEEEIGSPTFAPFLEEYADLLAADVVVIADSSNWEVGIPAFTTSLRGARRVVRGGAHARRRAALRACTAGCSRTR